MKNFFLVISLSTFFMQAMAGEHDRSLVLLPSHDEFVMTGNVETDLFGGRSLSLAQQSETTLSADEHHKSLWLAAGLSAVLPGAGEYYAEDYWKAAAFLAADVAFIALAYSFDKKGDNHDAANGAFADEHWSVVRYVEKTFETFTDIDQTKYRGIIISTNTSLPPWERVDWNLVNQLEREVGGGPGDLRRSYSHTLPRRPEQQYFELIGKYGQYTLGWDDFSGVYNPYESENRGRFRFYADERAKTEDFYSKASTFVTITIINHLLSAADAAWTASTFNKHLHTSMRLQRVPTVGGFANVPVARVEYSF